MESFRAANAMLISASLPKCCPKCKQLRRLLYTVDDDQETCTCELGGDGQKV